MALDGMTVGLGYILWEHLAYMMLNGPVAGSLAFLIPISRDGFERL